MFHRTRAAFVAAVLAMAILSPAGAFGRESDEEWKAHKAQFEKAMASGVSAEMETAVRDLARGDRPEAVDLLIKVLDYENPKISGFLAERAKVQEIIEGILKAYLKGNTIEFPSQGEQDRYQRAINDLQTTEAYLNNAAVEALSAIRDPEAVERMVTKGMKDSSWRVRAGVAQALGEIKADSATAVLIKAVDDKDPKVQTAAIDALANMGKVEAIDAITKNLADKDWQIRVTAARALGRLGQKESIKPLVDQMQKEEGRMLEDFDAALKDLTGHTTHGNPRAWQSWYNANQSRLDEIVSRREASGEGDAEVGKTVTFYGITTKSKRIIFIIDISGSMEAPGIAPPSTTGGPNVPGNVLPSNPKRIDVAKWELKNAVASLPEDAKFNIIYFNQVVDLLQANSMMTASKNTKEATYRWIDGLQHQGLTNIYDSLIQAFDLAGRGAIDANYKIGVDTIFFLTDGEPTAGTIQDKGKILDDIKQRNSLRKIKIHVIGIGSPGQGGDSGIDVTFLKKLAEDNGGEFVNR